MTEHVPETLPARVSTPELDRFARVGKWLASAEIEKPSESKQMAAALRLFYAESLDLSPLAAAELSMINGRLQVSSQLLRALARRAGYLVASTYLDDQKCTAQLISRDTGQVLGEATYTMEDARRAGLAGKDNYKRNPARMMWARAPGNVIKDFAPEVALGMVTDEEAPEVLGDVDDIDFDVIPASPIDQTDEYEAEHQPDEAEPDPTGGTSDEPPATAGGLRLPANVTPRTP